MNDVNYGTIRWVMITLAIIILSVFLWQIRSILLYGLAAIILVILISIPVNSLMRLGVPRTIAIFATLAAGFAFLTLIFMLVLPTLVDQFVILGQQITSGLEELARQWNSGEIQDRFPFLRDIELIDFSRENPINIETARNVFQQGIDTFGQLSGSVLPFIGGIANTILSLLIVFFLTMFFIAKPETYKNGFVKLFPLWYRHRIEHILHRLYGLLRRWIFAALIGMTITGVGTFLGLSMVGIEQAVALGVMTAFFSFVPNFGELASVSVSLAVGAVQAPDRLLWIIIVIYGVSFLQGQIIGPLITSESVEIPPVLLLLGQIVVARFFGFLGILLAVPIMVIVMVLIHEIYVIDILGDKTEAAKVADEAEMPLADVKVDLASHNA